MGAAAADGSCLAGKPGNENKRRDLDAWELALSHPQWTSGAMNFRPGKQDSKSEALGLAGEGEPHLATQAPPCLGPSTGHRPCPGLSSRVAFHCWWGLLGWEVGVCVSDHPSPEGQ